MVIKAADEFKGKTTAINEIWQAEFTCFKISACRGNGKQRINMPALDKLQALRDRLGKPLIDRSA